MKVLISTVQVPFVHGGAELHARGLCEALRRFGNEAEIVAVPFKWYPPERILDHMLACSLLDVSETMGTRIDRMIALKFPAYLIPHEAKVLWLLHQHKTAYEMWDHDLSDLAGHPNGLQVRDAIRQADRETIPEARAVFANSATVARRLKMYCGIDSKPLYHPPPHSEQFYCADPEAYFFCPSRLSPAKRQMLVIRALSRTRKPVRVKFAGSTEDQNYERELQGVASCLGVSDRVDWLGRVSDEEKISLYAQARGVIFAPIDEDYGYVTLEAMLASKPVITCPDSGGPLEFVLDGETGLIASPAPEALAEALDQLWEDQATAKRLGAAGRSHYASFGITWASVVESLLS